MKRFIVVLLVSLMTFAPVRAGNVMGGSATVSPGLDVRARGSGDVARAKASLHDADPVASALEKMASSEDVDGAGVMTSPRKLAWGKLPPLNLSGQGRPGRPDEDDEVPPLPEGVTFDMVADIAPKPMGSSSKEGGVRPADVPEKPKELKRSDRIIVRPRRLSVASDGSGRTSMSELSNVEVVPDTARQDIFEQISYEDFYILWHELRRKVVTINASLQRFLVRYQAIVESDDDEAMEEYIRAANVLLFREYVKDNPLVEGDVLTTGADLLAFYQKGLEAYDAALVHASWLKMGAIKYPAPDFFEPEPLGAKPVPGHVGRGLALLLGPVCFDCPAGQGKKSNLIFDFKKSVLHPACPFCSGQFLRRFFVAKIATQSEVFYDHLNSLAAKVDEALFYLRVLLPVWGE